MFVSWSATPSSLARCSARVRSDVSKTPSARPPDRARDPAPVQLRVGERCVLVAAHVHLGARDEVVERGERDRVAACCVGDRGEHEIVGRGQAVELRTNVAEGVELVFGRELAVGDVVDPSRKGVDGEDRVPPVGRQQAHPGIERRARRAGDAAALGVRGRDVHAPRRSVSNERRAFCTRVARGVLLSTSKLARSIASRVARPPPT